ncbi:MAG: hypothetical protein WCO66_01240 [Candidatus Absconditabacteria bacterium]
MKRIQKYIKNIGFVLLALVGVTFVVVYAAGAKNILYDGTWAGPLVWDQYYQDNSGFKLGINDYIIMEKDAVNHTCKYYQGLTANKVYVPNFKNGELDAFKAHFPTRFAENQTIGTPYCNYEDEGARSYDPVGCYNSSGMTNLVWPYAYSSNGHVTWNCPSLQASPCEENVSCDLSPCSTTGCYAGNLTAGTYDTDRTCGIEEYITDPNNPTQRTFSCSVSNWPLSVCSNTVGECLGTTETRGSTYGKNWTCRSTIYRNYSYELHSCSATVCGYYNQYNESDGCIGGSTFVNYSYGFEGGNTWQCEINGYTYSCPGN